MANIVASEQGFDSLTGEYRVAVTAQASFVLGSDPGAEKHQMILEGFARIREWPAAGYERRVLDDGRVQIDLEMVESYLEGETDLGKVTIRETPRHRNFGTLTQVTPGVDFPAEFALNRIIEIGTVLGPLHNDEPIQMRGTFDAVPPLTTSDTFDGVNIPQAVNTPVPLFNDVGEQVGYFSGSKDSADNCRAKMTRVLD